MALFIANPGVAATWYHNMISSPAGQNKYGSTEGMTIDGKQVSPMVTWDSKITTVIGMMGGFADAVKLGVAKLDSYTTFMTFLTSVFQKSFPTVKGTD